MTVSKPNIKILLDGGDPDETRRIKDVLGRLDGQTTNPTYVAKNPKIQERIAAGHKLTKQEQEEEYRHIVQQISPLVGDSGVSIEVFADFDSTAEQMLEQGEKMFTWIPNAYIKYPCTHEGLRAAGISARRAIRVNLTLCFSQEQAAAVYAVTKDAKAPVYISPFVGRLDDKGIDGMELVKNIKRMYDQGDGHVQVLVASLRRQEHLLDAMALHAELATLPANLLDQWVGAGRAVPDQNFHYSGMDGQGRRLKSIPYRNLNLNTSWESFDIRHELTDQGITKFVTDYKSTLASAA